MPADMTPAQAAEHQCVQQVGGKWLLSTRAQRVASLQMRRRVVQMAHGDYRRE